MKNILLMMLLQMLSQGIYGQHLFEKKYNGCDTKKFSLESDSAIAKVSDNEIRKVIVSSVNPKSINKIYGDLLLQVLVSEDGSSCLLSLENRTNVKTKRLNLKEAIDHQLKWGSIDKKVAAIIAVKFGNQRIDIKRLGLNGISGIQEIKHD
ncbi:MAG: hypothetical protein AAFO69_09595 [Bacteroidota bacterium]